MKFESLHVQRLRSGLGGRVRLPECVQGVDPGEQIPAGVEGLDLGEKCGSCPGVFLNERSETVGPVGVLPPGRSALARKASQMEGESVDRLEHRDSRSRMPMSQPTGRLQGQQRGSHQVVGIRLKLAC